MSLYLEDTGTKVRLEENGDNLRLVYGSRVVLYIDKQNGTITFKNFGKVGTYSEIALADLEDKGIEFQNIIDDDGREHLCVRHEYK